MLWNNQASRARAHYWREKTSISQYHPTSAYSLPFVSLPRPMLNEKHLQQQRSFPNQKKMSNTQTNQTIINNPRAVKDIHGPAKLPPEEPRTLGSAIAVLAVSRSVGSKPILPRWIACKRYAKVLCTSQIFSA